MQTPFLFSPWGWVPLSELMGGRGVSLKYCLAFLPLGKLPSFQPLHARVCTGVLCCAWHCCLPSCPLAKAAVGIVGVGFVLPLHGGEWLADSSQQFVKHPVGAH